MVLTQSNVERIVRKIIKFNPWNEHRDTLTFREEGISAVTTSKTSRSQERNFHRNIKSINNENEDIVYSRLVCDSHADISCAGSDAMIIEFVDGRTCTVHPFNETYYPKEKVQLCNVAFAFDKTDGETYTLKVNQCLDFRKEMCNSLISTNQVISHGIIVEDTPMSIYVTGKSRQEIIIPEKDIILPLRMYGPVPYFPVRNPCDNELDMCHWLELSSEEKWDPEIAIGNEKFEINKIAAI